MNERDPVSRLLWGSLPVAVQSTVAASTSSLVCGNPPLLLADATGSEGSVLMWNVGAAFQLANPAELFWEFLDLNGASDAAIASLAQAYGPLLPSRGADSVHQEPVAGWRALCRGLNAIYDLALSERGWAEGNSDTRIWARAATLAVAVLTGEVSEITEPELMLANLGGLTGAPPQGTPLEHATSAFLQAAGIAPRFSLLDGTRMYAVPVVDEAAAGGRSVWVVDGSLPILAISLATAVLSLERPRCTRCGKVARIVGRRPRAGSPWYGDHEVCRAEAKQDAVNRYHVARAARSAGEMGQQESGS